MNYRSDTIRCSLTRAGFSFVEVVAALAILGVLTGSVLVVLNRSVEAVIDGRSRMQAFQRAHRNMEELLSSNSVTDKVEFGPDEFNEDIEWETVVESFNEPLNSKMWVRATCSASFTDRHGERQRVELTHWLTQLSKSQENQILDQQKRQQDFLDQTESNPFGNDPDGLMQYAESLISMGDYAKAAEALARISLEHPDSPLAGDALKKIPTTIEALARTDPAAANKIVPQLVKLLPDEPDIQSLPDLTESTPPGDPQDNKPPNSGKKPLPDSLKDMSPELLKLFGPLLRDAGYDI